MAILVTIGRDNDIMLRDYERNWPSLCLLATGICPQPAISLEQPKGTCVVKSTINVPIFDPPESWILYENNRAQGRSLNMEFRTSSGSPNPDKLQRCILSENDK